MQQEAQARGGKGLFRWHCDRLRPILDSQITDIVKRFGASPHSVQLRELGYRWGLCGHKGDLYFHAPCGDATAIAF
ncbi:MAG TPA: YgjP-like metallopeptidase domain-containing protein [Leptolyngbyaceae cyanobacterium]